MQDIYIYIITNYVFLFINTMIFWQIIYLKMNTKLQSYWFKNPVSKFDTFKSLFHFTLFFIYILIKEKNSIREKKYLI